MILYYLILLSALRSQEGKGNKIMSKISTENFRPGERINTLIEDRPNNFHGIFFSLF